MSTSGTVTKRYTYDAFGNELNPSEGDTNPWRYCGEYFDKETGTYYLRARYYSPGIGRFLAEDTHWNPSNMIYGDSPVKINERKDALGLNIYTLVSNVSAIRQSSNLYVYCGGNPILFIDPSGEFFFLVTAAVGAVAGAVVGGVAAAVKGENVVKGAVKGAVVGGVIGAGAGAAVAYVAAGSATVSTGAVMAGVGIAGTGAVGGAATIATKYGNTVLNAGNTMRERLLNTVQNTSLSNLVNQLYRPGSSIGDGGTAQALMSEFIFGATKATAVHYNKSVEMIGG